MGQSQHHQYIGTLKALFLFPFLRAVVAAKNSLNNGPVILFLLSIVLLFVTSCATERSDSGGVTDERSGRGAQSCEISDVVFHLAYTNSSGGADLQEYLPTGQYLDAWTNLFAVRNFKNLDSPKDYILHLAAIYHREHSQMPFAIDGVESNNVYFVDFLMGQAKGKLKFWEWNFFRAQTNPTGGLTVFQYADRIYYRKSIKEINPDDMRALRLKMLPVLVTNDFKIERP